MRTYYTEVIGLSAYDEGDGVVYLASGGPGPALEPRPASGVALDHVGFEIAASQEDELLTRLAKHEVTVTTGSDVDPGFTRLHALTDAERNHVQVGVIDGHRAAAEPAVGGVVPQKLGHVATRTSSAAAVTAFYETALGFRWSDWMGDFFAFLRCNADHHTVNLVNAARPGDLHHLAFEVQDVSHLAVACDALATRGIP